MVRRCSVMRMPLAAQRASMLRRSEMALSGVVTVVLLVVSAVRLS
jgi:hypothetical protein